MEIHSKIIASFNSVICKEATAILDDNNRTTFESFPLNSKGIVALAVLDKYTRSRVIPAPKKLIYTEYYLKQRNQINEKLLPRLKKLEEMLKNGDREINKTKPKDKSFVSENINRFFDKNGFICDFLLADLDIKHFHLSQNRKDNKLVFSIINGNIAYLICIGNHSDIYSSQKESLITKVLTDEFPEYLNVTKPMLYGIDPGTTLNTQEVKNIRKLGVNILHQDNSCETRIPINGLTSFSRIPLEITRNYDQIVFELQNICNARFATTFFTNYEFIGIKRHINENFCIMKVENKKDYDITLFDKSYYGLSWLLNILENINQLKGNYAFL